MNVSFSAVLAVAFVLFAVAGVTGRTIDVRSYPVAGVRYLERNGLRGPDHRLATSDVVGCWLILRDGRSANVFIDDRVDMYPVEVTKDYVALLRGQARAVSVLDRHRIDVVLWERDLPLASILRATEGWRQVHRQGQWVVFRRA